MQVLGADHVEQTRVTVGVWRECGIGKLEVLPKNVTACLLIFDLASTIVPFPCSNWFMGSSLLPKQKLRQSASSRQGECYGSLSGNSTKWTV